MLFRSTLQFLTLLTPEYHLVAGTPQFVERAIGSTAIAAYERFFEMFCTPDVPDAIREVYSGVIRYSPFTRTGVPTRGVLD